VEFYKYKDRLEITDDLVGGLEHIIFSNLHLHHGVCIERIEPLSYMLSQGDVNLKLSFLIKQTVFELTLGEYLHSPHYQCSQPAKKFHLRYRDKLPSSYKIIFEFL
jgi:hypothetical protein